MSFPLAPPNKIINKIKDIKDIGKIVKINQLILIIIVINVIGQCLLISATLAVPNTIV